jgi:eukaryotic-like serine/threonine-protein kinase
MNSYRHTCYLLALAGCCLIFLLAACSSGAMPPTKGGTTPTAVTGSTPAVAPGTTPTPVATTVLVPPTQTSCPPAGTARALVTAPLALGSHATIVYLVIDSSASTLKRYDVTTGQRTEIVQLPGASIGGAQVSADGQWVLFTNGSKLQVVRMDGQGLQTLYCDTTSHNFQWSTNQRLIAFESKSGSTGFVKLLRVADGTIETALSQPLNTPYAYQLRTWLDTTRLYLTRYDTDVPPDALAVLDLNKGLHQAVNNLVSVVKREPGVFQDFDNSYDGSQVFVAHSPCAYSCSGPGNITVQPALGGTEHLIYSSQAYSVVQVRAVTQHTLLFRVWDHGFRDPSSGDLSHNGLWMVHTDGTGVTRLTTDSAHLYTNLNVDSQYPWSNVSRDGSLYAVEQQTLQTSGHTGTVTLFFGSLSGGTPTRFAWMSDGTQLSIVGWTTIP